MSRTAGAEAKTRLAVLRAAEKLLAERGVDAVSLREVGRVARVKNHAQMLRLFPTREALVDGILERHADAIQAHFTTQIDLLEQRGELTLRALLDVMARPVVAKLDDPDGGAEYVSIAAQLATHPVLPLFARPAASSSPGVLRLMSAMLPLVQIPDALILVHQERVAGMIYGSVRAYGRLAGAEPDPKFREVFISDLVDTLTAILAAPPSPRTQQLIYEAGLLPTLPYTG